MRTLEISLKGGQVKRFHTEATIGQETVAEHSFGVAMICHYLKERPSARLINAALFHDLAEQVTGDIPAPTKWKHPLFSAFLGGIEEDFDETYELKRESLTEEEAIILKNADSLQCMWYCIEQRKLGNKNMDIIFNRLCTNMIDLQKTTPKAMRLLNEYRQLYREAKR